MFAKKIRFIVHTIDVYAGFKLAIAGYKNTAFKGHKFHVIYHWYSSRTRRSRFKLFSGTQFNKVAKL